MSHPAEFSVLRLGRALVDSSAKCYLAAHELLDDALFCSLHAHHRRVPPQTLTAWS